MALIEVDRLNVWMATADLREIHAVRDVSLTLSEGGQLAIVGESGSGKSTLLLSLMGLLPPTARVSGRIFVDGFDVLAGPESGLAALRWRVAAMVFQASSNPLNPVRTVGRQLRQVLEFHGATRSDAKARTRELIAMVRLPEACEGYYPHQLSGGMRQRAVIALALACRPRILLADEPTTALDPIVQAEILELLFSLRRSLNLALVLVSHELQLVNRMEGNLAVMLAGEVVEYGPVRRLMEQPKHEHLRTLIAALPVLGGRSQDADAAAAGRVAGR